MGTYATTTAIIPKYMSFPQTTTVARYTATTILISDYITNAESEINATLARRYVTPFDPVPPEITRLTEDLAAGYTLRSKFTRDSHNTSDWVLDIIDAAKEQLKLIRESEIDLVNTSGAIIAERDANSKVISNTENYQAFFDLDTATSWKVDSDYLDTINR